VSPEKEDQALPALRAALFDALLRHGHRRCAAFRAAQRPGFLAIERERESAQQIGNVLRRLKRGEMADTGQLNHPRARQPGQHLAAQHLGRIDAIVLARDDDHRHGDGRHGGADVFLTGLQRPGRARRQRPSQTVGDDRLQIAGRQAIGASTCRTVATMLSRLA
jgi:hypothetical protein